MRQSRTKFSDGEFKVLAKLYHGRRLTIGDHTTLYKTYERHGISSVYMALRNLSGDLPHITKRLAYVGRK